MTAVEIKSRLWELGQIVQSAQLEAQQLYQELKALDPTTPTAVEVTAPAEK